jgi:hypothetical protein
MVCLPDPIGPLETSTNICYVHSLNQGQFNILPSILPISQISEMRAADLVHAPLASVFTIYLLLHGSHTDMDTDTVSQSLRNALANSTS